MAGKDKGKDKGKGKGKGKAKDKDDSESFVEIVEVNKCDKEFNILGAIIGPKGSHTRHIKDATGGRVRVVGEHRYGEEVYCKVLGDTQEQVDKARELLRSLLDNAYA